MFNINDTVYFYDKLFNAIRKGKIEYKISSETLNEYCIRDTENYKLYDVSFNKCFKTLQELEDNYKVSINKEVNGSYLKLNQFNGAMSVYLSVYNNTCNH